MNQDTPPSEGPEPLALRVEDVDALDIVVAMRFAFFGASGWKSDASRDKELLFDDRRLAMRLQLLKVVALASLAAQDDQNFHVFILTSEDLPADARAALEATCAEMLGPDQFTIAAAPPAPARKHLRIFLTKRYGKSPVMQVVLDDDDGLATDYMTRLRQDMRAYLPEQTLNSGGPKFISYSHGFGMEVGEDLRVPVRLYSHRYPFINLGLAMLTEPDKKNIFGIDHLRAPKVFGCLTVRRLPMWVRSVHFSNDSRVQVTRRWQPVESWKDQPIIRERFEYLDHFSMPRS